MKRNLLDRIDPRLTLMILLVTGVLIAGTALSQVRAQTAPTATPTLAATPPAVTSEPVDPSATPLPREFLENDRQTIGITFAALALVLVVVIGVMRANLSGND